MRLRADDQSLGPAMCETFGGRDRAAAASPRPRPPTWSTATTGTMASGVSSTATSGTSITRRSSSCVIPSCAGVEEDALDALALQLLERLEQRSAVERGEPGDADGVPVRVRGALEPEQHRGRPERDRVDADDPERLRPAGHQRLRGAVRAIVQLAHRREHPLARVPAHVLARVDDARDGLRRDAGELGHVAHRRGPVAARSQVRSTSSPARSMTHRARIGPEM